MPVAHDTARARHPRQRSARRPTGRASPARARRSSSRRSCALLLAVRFVVFPQVDDYRDASPQRLSRELGQPVAIDAIATGWDGWNPRLSISGLRIRDARGAGARRCLLPQRRADVAWTSLVAARAAAAGAHRSTPAARDPPRRDGSLAHRRLRDRPASAGGDSRLTDWLLRQREIVVRDALVCGTTSCATRRSSCSTTCSSGSSSRFGRHPLRARRARRPPSSRRRSTCAARSSAAIAAGLATRPRAGSTCASTTPTSRRGANGSPVPQPSRRPARARCALWFDVAARQAARRRRRPRARRRAHARRAATCRCSSSRTSRGRVTWQRRRRRDASRRDDLTLRDARRRGARRRCDFTFDGTKARDGGITGGRASFDRLEVAPLSRLWPRTCRCPRRCATTSRARAARHAARRQASLGGAGRGARAVRRRAARSRASASRRASVARRSERVRQASRRRARRRAEARQPRHDASRCRACSPTRSRSTRYGHVRWRATTTALRVDGRATSLRERRTRRARRAGAGARASTGPGIIDLTRAARARRRAAHAPLSAARRSTRACATGSRTRSRQGVATTCASRCRATSPTFRSPTRKKGTVPASRSRRERRARLRRRLAGDRRHRRRRAVRRHPAGDQRARAPASSASQLGPVKVDIADLGAPHPALSIDGEASGPTTEFLRFVDEESRRRLDRPLLRRRAGDRQRQARAQVHAAARQARRTSRSTATTQFIANPLRLPGVPRAARRSTAARVHRARRSVARPHGRVYGGPAKIAVSSARRRRARQRERHREPRRRCEASSTCRCRRRVYRHRPTGSSRAQRASGTRELGARVAA